MAGAQEIGSKAEAGPSSSSKAHMRGRASLKSPEAKKNPSARASSSSSISRTAKPAWSDLPAAAPAKTVVKSRVELINGPQKQAKKELPWSGKTL